MKIPKLEQILVRLTETLEMEAAQDNLEWSQTSYCVTNPWDR